MSILTKKALDRARAKRQKRLFRIEDFLFTEQLAFVRDPAPNKVAICSRRAGKTVSCAADLIETALGTPNVVCLYITLSRNNAKKIIWKELLKINKDYSLGGIENQTELSLTFPNSSMIYASGAKDTNEIEKFRGLALKKVYIDEAQSFREFIRDLIDDVLSPALMDYAGTLCMTGTPGPVPVGFFAEACGAVAGAEKVSQGWSKHAWTFWDNPFIIKKSGTPHQAMLNRELKRRGVTENDPSIQREWFGKWVLDSDSLLLHYSAAKNDFTDLPRLDQRSKWNYIMGVDLGFNDADAIAVLAWSDDSPATYLIEEVVTAQQGLTELVTQIQALTSRYDIDKIVMDEGGLGKKAAEEMRRQHHIPIHPADKKRKMENIAFLNDAMRTGRFMAKSRSLFAEDSFKVEIDRDKSTPDRIAVSSRFHSDIIDAVLYAFKESPAFTYQAPRNKPKVGSPEWAEEQEDEMWEAEMAAAQEEMEQQKRMSGYE